jgi:hypothetical protein
MSFLVRFLRQKVSPPVDATPSEKLYQTRESALTFCVILRNMGGEVIELVQCIGGREDAVLDGPGLEGAITRQRIHIEQDAQPPWL